MSVPRSLLTLGWLVPLLAACTAQDATLMPPPPEDPNRSVSTSNPTPAPASPTAPVPSPGASDGSGEQLGELVRGPFYLDETELVILESYPYQLRLILRGSLPTPCATLHWAVEPPDEAGRIQVQVYSLEDPNLACIQILHSIEESIPLGSLTEGQYSVWLNGELVEDFEL